MSPYSTAPTVPTASTTSPRRWIHAFRLLFLAAFLLSTAGSAAPLTAQTDPVTTSQCFVVADGYINDQGEISDGADTLAFLRLQTGETEPVGGRIPNLNTTQIEAIAFRPNSTTLYAANANRLGILDLTSATFSGYPETFGTSGTQTFNDVDGLSFNPLTGELWGVNVNPGALDVLFKIDLVTGGFIPGEFEDPNNPGLPADYLVIQSGSIVHDIDDIAIDPVDGSMYAIVTGLRSLANLAIIDPIDGSVTQIGQFTRATTGAPLKEIEGLGFGSDGQLYGTTGYFVDSQNVPGPDVNLLWRIDKTTGVANLVGEFNERLIDIEALDCLGTSGFLVFESYVNNVDADRVEEAITVRAGETVTRTYLIRNTGAFALSGVTVVDDNGTPDDTSDDITVCQEINLPIGQSETCQRTETAQQGLRRLAATVTATDTLGNPYTQEDVTYYIAFAGSAVGGRVWNDRNGNGLDDPAESGAGIDGVSVTLYDSSGSVVTTIQTANSGAYLFNNLQPGDYALGATLPPFYRFTPKDVGDDDTIDSDFEPDPTALDFGRTITFTLADGVIDQRWDAGLISEITTGSIGGYVWNDLNADGIQNDGEPSEVGIEGVTVTLSERVEVRSAQILSTTTTMGDGSYRFQGIPAGDYHVEFTSPEGYVFTAQNAGDSEATDSDANPETGRTGIVELETGESKEDVDAGLIQVSTIYLPEVLKE
ncbi:hypothetical protein GC175_21955 [bacterium]|nr:hypothetical protein [bacterium]